MALFVIAVHVNKKIEQAINKGENIMTSMDEAAQSFLKLKRIAVFGVSRKGGSVGNYIYKKLRKSGYQVFPINPNAESVEGDTCYPDLAALPEAVEGVVMATHPKRAEAIVRDCAAQGVQQVWMHRSLGMGSMDEDAAALGRELGLTVIPGGCPMMFCDPVDLPHKCLRWFLDKSGKLPA